jgi:peptide/nickel transport system permease protein
MWMVGRVLSSALVLAVVSLMLFAMCRATPVSPARIVLGIEATQADIAAFEQEHGLDLPVLTQYWRWLGEVARGRFGESYITGLPIGAELAQTFPLTLELVTLSFVLAVMVSTALGVWAAIREDGWPDHAVRMIAMIGVSIPGFWLALLLIRYAAVQFGWFPPGGYQPLARGLFTHLRALALPALSIAVYYIAVLSRLTRASMIEALSQDYVRTAQAMGLPQPRIWLYALKNALPPVVSVAAMAFGYMFGWALIIEQVFNIPGVSRALLNAVFQRDYPTVQSIVLVITVIFILSNLTSDVLQRVLNPRLTAA